MICGMENMITTTWVYPAYFDRFQIIKVFLGLKLNNIIHGAGLNVELLDVILLNRFKFMQYCWFVRRRNNSFPYPYTPTIMHSTSSAWILSG